MAQFYIELKELRESRKIALEEIHNRTKINIKYLEAIEKGNFEILPVPYLRLFLRAYADEIGGDSVRALEQLDSFLGTNRTPIQTILIPKKDDIIDEQEKQGIDKDTIFPSNKKLREDLIKGSILLIIFIFSIMVFNKIFNSESSAVLTNDGLVIKQNVKLITESELIKNYIQLNSREEMLDVSPPFFIKLITREQTAFSFKNDTLAPITKYLQANFEFDLEAFVSKSEILFSSTDGLTIFINGVQIENISNYNNPLKLTIKPSPPALIMQRFKPLK